MEGDRGQIPHKPFPEGQAGHKAQARPSGRGGAKSVGNCAGRANQEPIFQPGQAGMVSWFVVT